jgi:hypothetical protein
MGMKPAEPLPAAAALEAQPSEQLRYARWLDVGSRAGLAVLVAVFFAYAAGFTEPLVSHTRLAEVWGLPVAEFLAATGVPTGWGWLGHVHRGDIANLIGIALLSGCSLLALLVLLPLYARQGDRAFLAISALQIVVLLLAASGVLTAGH